MSTTQIPRHESDLRVTHDTTRQDAIDYLSARLDEPAVVEGSVVFNFHGRDLDAAALVNNAEMLTERVYVVPYQVPGMWGFMVELLPAFVADASLLVYRSSQGCYVTYPNLRENREQLQAEAIETRLSDTAAAAVGEVRAGD